MANSIPSTPQDPHRYNEAASVYPALIRSYNSEFSQTAKCLKKYELLAAKYIALWEADLAKLDEPCKVSSEEREPGLKRANILNFEETIKTSSKEATKFLGKLERGRKFFEEQPLPEDVQINEDELSSQKQNLTRMIIEIKSSSTMLKKQEESLKKTVNKIVDKLEALSSNQASPSGWLSFLPWSDPSSESLDFQTTIALKNLFITPPNKETTDSLAEEKDSSLGSGISPSAGSSKKSRGGGKGQQKTPSPPASQTKKEEEFPPLSTTPSGPTKPPYTASATANASAKKTS